MSAPAAAPVTVALALIESAPDRATANRQVHAASELGASRNAIRRAWNAWRIGQTYRAVRP